MKRGDSNLKSWRESDALFDIDSSLVAISHELKSPLALIRQLSLCLELSPVDSSYTQKYLQQITATSERGLRLASDITRASRLNQLELNFEPVSPTEVCHQVVKEMATLYRIYDQKLVVRTCYRQRYLAIADYNLLKSILTQLCDNALSYALSDLPIELSVSKHKGAKKIRISVRDFGPRLPKSVWRSLKSRQPIAPQSISSRPLSSGLGLYLSSKFATLMNAELGAVSHTDGTTFYIDLDISNQLTLV